MQIKRTFLFQYEHLKRVYAFDLIDVCLKTSDKKKTISIKFWINAGVVVTTPVITNQRRMVLS